MHFSHSDNIVLLRLEIEGTNRLAYNGIAQKQRTTVLLRNNLSQYSPLVSFLSVDSLLLFLHLF